MKIYKVITIISCLLLMSNSSFAQVQIKIDWQHVEQQYLVSMISDVTWDTPYNRTSSAQITIKAPTGQLEIEDLTSLQNNVSWEANSRSDAPIEAPESDYISIAMTSLGTSGLSYQEGVEIPLFTFKSSSGCVSNVRLIDNNTDAFMPPNSRNSNVGNQITTLGARGEAFSGVTGRLNIDCDDITVDDEASQNLTYNIYPNPAVKDVFVNIEWKKEPTAAKLKLRTIDGKEANVQAINLETGINEFKMGIDKLAGGVYHLYVEGEDWSRNMEEVVVTK